MASADLKVIITGDARGLSRAYKDAERSTSRFGGAVGKLGILAGGAAVAGVGALAVGLKRSVDSAMEAERVQASLAAQMRASGLSMDQNREAIDKTVGSLSRMSGIDDEALVSAFTRLVRSTGDVKKAQEQMALVADMARAKQMDVGAAADVVGKAIDGNVGILKRYGVEIEKGATVTEALGQAQQAFAGQAKAYGDTTAGAQDRVKVAMENVQETIGAKLLPAFNQVLLWASNQMPKIEAFFNTHGDSIKKMLNGIASFIRTTWVPIFNTGKQIAQAMIQGVRNFMDNHGTEVERIFGRIKTAVGAVSTVMLFLAQKVVTPILKPMFQSVLPTVLGVAVTAIDKVSGALAKVVSWIQWIGQKGAMIISKFADAVKKPAQLAADALRGIANVLGSIVNFMDGITGRVQGLINAIGKIKSVVGSGLGAVGDAASWVAGKRAAGGPVSAGRAYLVGERGPELFVPGATGTIVPNAAPATRGMAASGASIVVNVSGVVGSPTDVAQVIRRELIRIGRDNGGNVLAGMA